MPLTVYPCRAAADEAVARELSRYLESATDVTVFFAEGGMHPGESLLAKVRDGLMAEVVLVLLSPDSAPARWVLEEWTPVFLEEPKAAGVALATVQVRPCRFPELLRRKNFFDLTTDRPAGFRAVRRWLLEARGPLREPRFAPGRPPEAPGREVAMEQLQAGLSDVPGTVTLSGCVQDTWLALDFARRCGPDFEDVFWLGGGGRNLTHLAGDLGAQVGLKLDGEVDRNVQALRQCLAARRYLLVLDALPEPDATRLIPGGRCSVLRTAAKGAPVSLEEILPEERWLLAAVAACSAGGFSLALAARVADMDLPLAVELARGLIERGLLLPLGRAGERYYLPAPVRSAVPVDRTCARRHAREDGLELPDVQRAFAWTLGRPRDKEAWTLAAKLARRGMALARDTQRLAEGFELIESLYGAAEPRGERRLLEECAWEMVWVLEHWERYDDARTLDGLRRSEYADQMLLEF